MRMLGLLVSLAFLLPVSASQSGLIFGTEELPELPPSGPPSYSSTYTGPKDHAYLEILAGWFSYDNGTDEIVWTLKVPDGRNYRSPPPNYNLGCFMQGNVANGDTITGRLNFASGVRPGSDVTHHVGFTYAQGNVNGTGETRSDDVVHSFTGKFDAPGYFEFRVQRSALLRYGTEVRDFVGRCSEYVYYDEETAVVTAQATRNAAQSDSAAVYSLLELRRVKGPDGALDPIEEFERNNTTIPTATLEGNEGAERTPGLGSGAIVLVLCASMVLVRRFRG